MDPVAHEVAKGAAGEADTAAPDASAPRGSVPRKILIVGNSDGIGATITRALVARGDRVVGVSRSPGRLGPEGPRHEIADAGAPDFGDVIRRIAAEEGGFDACIYCAGIGSGLRLPDLSGETRVFDVNLMGMVRTIEALVPEWLERGSGHFIGLSSLADDVYVRDAPSYSASKVAMSRYLVALGLELRRHGVAVTNIRLGFVDTKMAQAPLRPMMMTVEAAGRHVLRCLETRPLQLSTPKLVGAAVRVLRWVQSMRVWTT
jgi:NAD(P)-dependent dehydrogenase (short-subunit alcohol dehydrogenase family)